jgi:alpha-methylacyl-CoA racemase
MLPLDHIRVLDLSRAVPGPYCSMLLGDMGADVLVVEPVDGDAGRPAPALRRNKRSIRVDLKHPDGRAVVHRLAPRVDVVLEGFRPGVVARLGVDPATLCALNPRLVYCSLTGFGQDGPYAAMPGHDLGYAALAGALGAVVTPGTRPAPGLNLVADLAAGGLMAAFAIVVALVARERTGRGQVLDHAMTDGVLSLLGRAANLMLEGGPVPRPGTERVTGALPHYDVYECADGRFLAVAPLEPRFHANMCAAIGAPELAAVGETAPPEERAKARARLAEIFRSKTRDQWFALLRPKDACAAPVYDLDEALADPHHVARRMVVEAAGLRQVAVMPKLTDTPGAIRRAPPRPGEHTDQVLAELGYGGAEIAALRAAKAVA